MIGRLEIVVSTVDEDMRGNDRPKELLQAIRGRLGTDMAILQAQHWLEAALR